MKLKIDLHVHSVFSRDGISSIDEIIESAKRAGLDGIALTDHNNIHGNRAASEIAKNQGLVFIPGTEVKSEEGDILALGIKNPIPKNLSAKETIELIHKQGALAIAAHPYSFPILHRECIGTLSEELGFDAIETVNSRTFFGNKKAQEIAKKLGIPEVGGSDAHMPREIGKAYTIVESARNTDSILKAIKKGKTQACGETISPISAIEVYARRMARKIRRMF